MSAYLDEMAKKGDEYFEKLAEQLAKVQNIDDAKEIYQHENIDWNDYYKYRQPQFLDLLIQKNASDEVILHFIDSKMLTVYDGTNSNTNISGYSGYINVLDTALNHKRYDLAEKIADSQINRHFEKYQLGDRVQYTQSTQDLAYQYCSAEMVKEIAQRMQPTIQQKKEDAIAQNAEHRYFPIVYSYLSLTEFMINHNKNFTKEVADFMISSLQPEVKTLRQLEKLYDIYERLGKKPEFYKINLQQFDTEAQKEIAQLKDFKDFDILVDVLSLKSLETLLSKGDSMAMKIAKERMINIDDLQVETNRFKFYKNIRRMIFTSMGERFDNPEQVQEYLNKYQDEDAKRFLMKGMRNNLHPEVAQYFIQQAFDKVETQKQKLANRKQEQEKNTENATRTVKRETSGNTSSKTDKNIVLKFIKRMIKKGKNE